MRFNPVDSPVGGRQVSSVNDIMLFIIRVARKGMGRKTARVRSSSLRNSSASAARHKSSATVIALIGDDEGHLLTVVVPGVPV